VNTKEWNTEGESQTYLNKTFVI